MLSELGSRGTQLLTPLGRVAQLLTPLMVNIIADLFASYRHTTVHVSSYCNVCPHATLSVLMLLHVFARA